MVENNIISLSKFLLNNETKKIPQIRSKYKCDIKMNKQKTHNKESLVNLHYTCNPKKLAISNNTKSRWTSFHIIAYNFLEPVVFLRKSKG